MKITSLRSLTGLAIVATTLTACSEDTFTPRIANGEEFRALQTQRTKTFMGLIPFRYDQRTQTREGAPILECENGNNTDYEGIVGVDSR